MSNIMSDSPVSTHMRDLLLLVLVLLLTPPSCSPAARETVDDEAGPLARESPETKGEHIPLRARLTGDPADSFAAGWQALGTCTSAGNVSGTNRDSVLAHLEAMRRNGLNAVSETASADGRIVARGVNRSWYNWYGYSYVDVDGREQRMGHPRPGAFVEGMRWMLDDAYGQPGDHHISLIIGLRGFVTPGYSGRPFGGSDMLPCGAFRSFIRNEIEHHEIPVRSRIPAVECDAAPARMPFWEWNVWYVVTHLADHPGLRAWYLWDEPEGIASRHLFGSAEPRRFDGPETLPTTDLLRYAYRLVHEFDPNDHPVIVDIHTPHVFFSDRFEWSQRPDPSWSSGPFDVSPSGDIHTPADILGLEASSYMVHPEETAEMKAVGWYWDPNYISRASSMLSEAAERDGKEAMVIAAQAQLPSRGPFAPAGPLRCGPNDNPRVRILNDRDVVWELLTTHMNGMYGYVYYTHVFMPYRGPGALQAERSTRLLRQFLDARLDRVFARPDEDGRISVREVRVDALTDYYRRPPARVGPVSEDDIRFAESSVATTVMRSEYRVGMFNRSPYHADYAAAVMRENRHVVEPDHELLRISLRRWRDADYLFLSNVYDARITARVRYSSLEQASTVAEGQFSLGRGDEFRWTSATDVVEDHHGGRLEMQVSLGPYEAKFFKIE